MYEQFYGFDARPFQLTPDYRFFFESSVHKKASSYLVYGLNQGEGFIVVTGEVGAGKTTLLKHLLSTLDPQQHVWAEIVTSQLGANAVLRMAATAWGLRVTRDDKASALSAIEQFLTDQHRQGRRCLLIVDEAQTLSIPALEELRMLSNFQVDGRSPLQSFLIGQPQFRRTLASKDLEQLRQRVIASYHLGPMTEAETAAYVRHRLSHVGWKGDPEFSDACMSAIYRHTGGIPRSINSLASRLLLFGFLDNAHGFDGAVVDQVAEELRQETEQVPGPATSPAPSTRGKSGNGDAAALVDLGARLDLLEARYTRLEHVTRQMLRLVTTYLNQ